MFSVLRNILLVVCGEGVDWSARGLSAASFVLPLVSRRRMRLGAVARFEIAVHFKLLFIADFLNSGC